MAAVSKSRSPHDLTSMSSRRLPLTSNPNAANSPYRAVVDAATRQKRSYATLQREEAYGQQPPAKKQMVESHQLLKTPTKQTQVAEGRSFAARKSYIRPIAFAQKHETARVDAAQQTKLDRESQQVWERVSEWQRTYRRIFPKCVFYFESVPEDVRVKIAKQVINLGARVEKFFSNAVTHVITTRKIPSKDEITTEALSMTTSHSQSNSTQTINPSLLDRSPEEDVQDVSLPAKEKDIFDSVLNSKRARLMAQEPDVRRQPIRNTDVLYRALNLGMKIWALEKLQRMVAAMFETEAGNQDHFYTLKNDTAPPAISRSTRESNLTQLLRNERIHGHSDRDPTVATKEMIIFKGPFIYVHDIDEKQRPIMVREYAKVAHKGDGDWPQFRSVANGKCPFVEDTDKSRRETEKVPKRQNQHIDQNAAASRTCASNAVETGMQPAQGGNIKEALVDNELLINRGIPPASLKQEAPFEIPSLEKEPSSKGPQNAFVSRAAAGRLFGGEPVASGLQASNVTSAIRSQMISSTAAQPGAKAGISKEVHGLQRKVLERNSNPPSIAVLGPHHLIDPTSFERDDQGTNERTKRTTKLGKIEECGQINDSDQKVRRGTTARDMLTAQKSKPEKKVLKPGYCENCMDKFEDFDEHIVSRKHRKFAERGENWLELDSLLAMLDRPFKADLYDEC